MAQALKSVLLANIIPGVLTSALDWWRSDEVSFLFQAKKAAPKPPAKPVQKVGCGQHCLPM